MTFEESIAKLNLGELSISQFPKIAMKAMELGIESESLLILAGMHEGDNAFEIKQYLSNVIEELGINSYQSLDAAFVLANSYVNKIKSGKLNIIEGISNIKNECWGNCEDLIASKVYVYDGIKFEKIIGSWYEYYEIDEHAEWVKESEKSISQIKPEIERELTQSLIKWQEEFLDNKLEELKKK